MKGSMAVCGCNPSTQETEAEGSPARSQPNLAYTARQCCKGKNSYDFINMPCGITFNPRGFTILMFKDTVHINNINVLNNVQEYQKSTD